MPATEMYLVRAHQSDLLRAACARRPHRCTAHLRRPRRTA